MSLSTLKSLEFLLSLLLITLELSLLLFNGTISCIFFRFARFARKSNKDALTSFSLLTVRSEKKAMNTHNTWNRTYVGFVRSHG